MSTVNVNQVERIASSLLGGVLLLRGLSRSSLTGTAIGAALLYRGISGHSYLYQTLGMNTAQGSQQQGNDMAEIERSITIEKPANELYRLWNDPATLSQVMGGPVDVTQGSEGRTHWQVHAPFGRTLEWDTQIVEDRPNEILRWQSVNGAQVANEGSIQFSAAPADWGTVATLRLRFDPPGGQLGSSIVSGLKMIPQMLSEQALRRFKSLAETGEIPTLEHNPSGRAPAYTH